MKKIVKYPVFDIEQTYIGTTAEEIDNIQHETEQDMRQRYGIGWDDGVEIILDETMPCIDEPTFMDYPYRDTDWAMYRFTGLETNVVKRLLELSDKWNGEVIVNVWVHLDKHKNSDDLFDTDSFYLYIYYHQCNKELLREIKQDKIISEHWSNSDAYTFDENTIAELKEKELSSKYWLNRLIRLSNTFNETFYDEGN